MTDHRRTALSVLLVVAAGLVLPRWPAAAADLQAVRLSLALGYRWQATETYTVRRTARGTDDVSQVRTLGFAMTVAGRDAWRGTYSEKDVTKQNVTVWTSQLGRRQAVIITAGSAGYSVPEGDDTFRGTRGLPAFPDHPTLPGAQWNAPATRFLSPDLAQAPIPFPVDVAYRYAGPATVGGAAGQRITADFTVAWRAPSGSSPGPGPVQVDGTHAAVIFLADNPRGPITVTDTFTETYRDTGGSVVTLTGTWALTIRIQEPALRTAAVEKVRLALAAEAPTASAAVPVSASAAAVAPAAALPEATRAPEPSRAAAPAATPAPAPAAGATEPASAPLASAPPPASEPPPSGPSIEVYDRPEGVALGIFNLRFVADSAALLPGQDELLGKVAATILASAHRSVLVVGHAADLGKPAGELQLSIDRARAVAGALERLGVPKDTVTVKGVGSTEPVADDATEAGRARNRRVEVILQD